ncbi:recombinase family protein [Natronorarus salvus]|uniref:recombinase family protein n=1 Tax=Natronorarus salvus TaxID=3117733 RepID=UPI002F26CA28
MEVSKMFNSQSYELEPIDDIVYMANLLKNGLIRAGMGTRINPSPKSSVQGTKKKASRTTSIRRSTQTTLKGEVCEDSSELDEYSENSWTISEEELNELVDEGIPLCADYRRVSTLKQTKGKSMENQKENNEYIADHNGLRLVYRAKDDGRSGQSMARPGLQNLYFVLLEYDIDYLIVDDFTRLGRLSVETHQLIYKLAEEGDVKLIADGVVIDASDELGKIISYVMAWSAEVEVQAQGRKAKESRTANFVNNDNWGVGFRSIPLGYKQLDTGEDSDGYWISQINNFGPVIEEVYERFIQADISRSYAETAATVSMQYPEILPKPLDSDDVKAIVTNPVYIGKPTFSYEKGTGVPENHSGTNTDEDLKFVSDEMFNKATEKYLQSKKRHSQPTDLVYNIEGMAREFGIPSMLDVVSAVVVKCEKCEDENGDLVQMTKSGTKSIRGIKCQRMKCPSGHIRNLPYQHELDRLRIN